MLSKTAKANSIRRTSVNSSVDNAQSVSSLWNTIRAFLVSRFDDVVYRRDDRNLSMMEYLEIYNTVYKAVHDNSIENCDRKLYDEYVKLVNCVLMPTFLREVKVEDYAERWQAVMKYARLVNRCLKYIHKSLVARTYITRKSEIDLVFYEAFRDHIINKPCVYKRITKLVNDIRESSYKFVSKELIDLINIFRFFDDVNILIELENHYVVVSAEYYNKIVNESLSLDQTFGEFITKFKTILNNEKKLAIDIGVLTEVRVRMITDKLVEICLRNRLDSILKMKQGISSLIENDKYDELRDAIVVFNECKLINELNKLIDIKLDINSDTDTLDVIRVIQKYQKIIDRCLTYSQSTITCIESMITSQINMVSDIVLKLSAYINKEIRAGNIPTDALICLKYLHEKDLFQKFYESGLANRLIHKFDVDIETKMIQELRMLCGSMFTRNCETMLKEIVNQNAISVSLDGINGTTLILTQGSWPKFDLYNVKYNDNVVNQLMNEMMLAYLRNNNNKKLTWVHSMTTCVIKAILENGDKTIVAPASIASVLLLFNNYKSLSMNEIVKLTGLDEHTALECVTSVSKRATGCAKLLVKNEKGCYEINKSFNHKLNNLNVVKQRLKKKEIDEIKQITDRDRRYAMDASIVRIMKVKKVMKHVDLFNEVKKQLEQYSYYTNVSNVMFKKQIESLIDREHIERDDNKQDTYHYLA